MDPTELSTIIDTYVVPWGIKIALALVIFYLGRMVVAMIVGAVGKVLPQFVGKLTGKFTKLVI